MDAKKNCWNQINEIAKQYNIENVYLGSGDPIDHPCIIVMSKDFWTGGTFGYNVYIYPEGEGYMKPYKCISVTPN